jgi:hypothetical protein
LAEQQARKMEQQVPDMTSNVQRLESTPSMRPRAHSQPTPTKSLPSSLSTRQPSSLAVEQAWSQYRDTSQHDVASPEATDKGTSSDEETDNDDYMAVQEARRWGMGSKSPSSSNNEYTDVEEEEEKEQPTSLFSRAGQAFKSLLRPSVLEPKVVSPSPEVNTVEDVFLPAEPAQSTATRTPIGATAKSTRQGRRKKKQDSPLSPSLQVPEGDLLLQHRPKRAAATRVVSYKEPRQDAEKWNKKRRDKRRAQSAKDSEPQTGKSEVKPSENLIDFD